MATDIINKIEREQIKKDVTTFHVGDTIKVHCRVVEGGKERIQVFSGIFQSAIFEKMRFLRAQTEIQESGENVWALIQAATACRISASGTHGNHSAKRDLPLQKLCRGLAEKTLSLVTIPELTEISGAGVLLDQNLGTA